MKSLFVYYNLNGIKDVNHSKHRVGAKYYCLNNVFCSGPEAHITE